MVHVHHLFIHEHRDRQAADTTCNYVRAACWCLMQTQNKCVDVCACVCEERATTTNGNKLANTHHVYTLNVFLRHWRAKSWNIKDLLAHYQHNRNGHTWSTAIHGPFKRPAHHNESLEVQINVDLWEERLWWTSWQWWTMALAAGQGPEANYLAQPDLGYLLPLLISQAL